jgi:hypothetical protein
MILFDRESALGVLTRNVGMQRSLVATFEDGVEVCDRTRRERNDTLNTVAAAPRKPLTTSTSLGCTTLPDACNILANTRSRQAGPPLYDSMLQV